MRPNIRHIKILNIISALVCIFAFSACTEKTIVELEQPSDLGSPVIENTFQRNALVPISSKKDILKLELNKEFSIPDKVYNEFIGNLVFVENEFRGCIYTGIENELNDTESYEFWSNLGINIRQLLDDGATFEGYRPRGTRGCKMNSNWVCHLPGPVFKDGVVSSKSNLLRLRLDKQFQIPQDIYFEFVKNIVFEEGSFRGCIYDRIAGYLDASQNQEFWSYFGIDFENDIRLEQGPIFVTYRPKRAGNCEKNKRWICVQ